MKVLDIRYVPLWIYPVRMPADRFLAFCKLGMERIWIQDDLFVGSDMAQLCRPCMQVSRVFVRNCSFMQNVFSRVCVRKDSNHEQFSARKFLYTMKELRYSRTFQPNTIAATDQDTAYEISNRRHIRYRSAGVIPRCICKKNNTYILAV